MTTPTKQDPVPPQWADAAAEDIVNTFNPPSTDSRLEECDVPWLAAIIARHCPSHPAPAEDLALAERLERYAKTNPWSDIFAYDLTRAAVRLRQRSEARTTGQLIAAATTETVVELAIQELSGNVGDYCPPEEMARAITVAIRAAMQKDAV